MNYYKWMLIFLASTLFASSNFAQQRDSSFIIKKDTIIIKTDSIGRIMAGQTELDSLSEYDRKRYLNQVRKDTIRANKKVWSSILGGPSYTPEASAGVGGALLASFKIDKNDSLSYRSFLPVGFNLSINGTIVIAGAGTFFFNENKFRIYSNYSYRNEPSHYYGKGMESAETTERSDTTTKFKKQSIIFNPRFVWMIKNNFYIGALVDINHSKLTDVNSYMATDEYFLSFKDKYLNVGLGGIIQYDTRDDIATPTDGMLVSATGKIYGKYLGGAYNYQVLDLEYRQFKHLFNRSTLAWVARTQVSHGDVPLTELPSFGSPTDLRGYLLGQYRDKSMAYGIAEYRHMFGTEESLSRGSLLSKLGFVTWVGAGSVAETPAKFNQWKFNYGAGLRIQIQPRKNFRLDIGKAHGTSGVQFYLNMTEAF
ncbi:MAG: BamA/TamA family outer membrane protein [Rikenellaceae bacterium]